MIGLHVWAPRVPGALVLVVGGLLASRLFDLSDHGVATVGEVPRGMPVPELPPWDIVRADAGTIALAAVALFLIGFSQTAGDARLFAARHRYRIRVDQEMVAQGMSNVGAGLFQGMPVSTSLSASSLNDTSGARTPMASIVTGVVVVLTLLRARPAVLRPPQARPRGDHHRRRRVRDDRHRRDAPVVAGQAGRLLDRRAGDRRRPQRRRARRRGDRHRAVGGLDALRQRHAGDQRARSRPGNLGVPVDRRVPGEQALSRAVRHPLRRGADLRHRRRPGRRDRDEADAGRWHR